MRKITLGLLFSAVVVVGLAAGYLYITAAPIRDTYANAIPPIPENWTEVPRDAQIDRLISQAQRDYWIRPIPRWRAKLVFAHAMSTSPNDLYLVFMPQGEAENAVVYCCSRENEKLLWKALWVRAA